MRWWQAEVLCDGAYIQPHTGGRVRIPTTMVVICKFKAPNNRVEALRKAKRIIRSKKKGYFRNDEITRIYYVGVRVLKDPPREDEFLVTIENRVYQIPYGGNNPIDCRRYIAAALQESEKPV